MENLVGRKLIALQDSTLGLTKGKEYEIIKQTNDKFWIITDKDTEEFTFLINSDLLKLVDEPQFKQGDKVLVSNDNITWSDRVFVIEHKGIFYCEHRNNEYELGNWGYIKPYEDEIKVGDWVKNNDFITKYTKEMAGNWTKITNPQLIELLNNEL